ncbi:MAG: HAMP domain-containing protein [Deltaproteobacteria bacterium]|nr:HAMP domain-containing protein [Deltaproteobacteria bacterium]MBW2016975.1 HAMP domain-containing protein [Deltaproteobacteria bacterium]MBW2129370.1 HAMP domain-containing protein [Deltaproteobacteria bacterium]MBW2303711.1 HAMP domain-containing protein [Deltaproteobacteria bacterium]
MGKSFYSLRTGILVELIFLILAAMLLINVVMVKFAERDLIQARVQSSRIVFHAIEQRLTRWLHENGRAVREPLEESFESETRELLEDLGEAAFVIFDSDGKEICRVISPGIRRQDLPLPDFQSFPKNGPSFRFEEKTWGVIWHAPRFITITAPFPLSREPFGFLHLRSSLEPLYRQLRASQRVILMYVLLDSFILLLVGGYLLSRIVLRPIRKLLKITSEYGKGEWIPPIEDESGNEIGELSKALNNMIKRLEENKLQLEQHVESLEKANRELRQAQQEIIRSEKFASVGKLAAGIAHEIGNPIGIVLGYIELLEKGEVSEEEKKDYLERMEEEITRINGIIRKLLDFSRPSEGEPEVVSVHDSLRKTLDILAPQPMMSEVTVHLHLEARKDRVFADSNQLQQVFLNVIMNAADAMAEGNPGGEREDSGSLTIRSECRDGAIELVFQDTGPGIGPEDLSRIFDPFFTTKEPGKGTGLGLSVSYSIIEGLGGTMEAESRPGEGTRIRITIPLHEGK